MTQLTFIRKLEVVEGLTVTDKLRLLRKAIDMVEDVLADSIVSDEVTLENAMQRGYDVLWDTLYNEGIEEVLR